MVESYMEDISSIGGNRDWLRRAYDEREMC